MKENVVRLGEAVATKTVDVITTGVMAVKAFNSVSTLLPTFALRSSVREMEVEKDLTLVDFQIQMALEIYNNTEEEYGEYISPERRAQAYEEFKGIADISFDAFDEIDAKLTLTERCANIAMKTLGNAHEASVMDKKRAAAQKAYDLIMGIKDETTIMSLDKTVIPVVEAAIDEAPTTITPFDRDTHREVRQSLAEAAVAIFESPEEVIEEKETPQIVAKPLSEDVIKEVMIQVTDAASQNADDDDNVMKDAVNNCLQQIADKVGATTKEELQDVIQRKDGTLEKYVLELAKTMSSDQMDALMMCLKDYKQLA